jgi:hypothetical protein
VERYMTIKNTGTELRIRSCPRPDLFAPQAP